MTWWAVVLCITGAHAAHDGAIRAQLLSRASDRSCWCVSARQTCSCNPTTALCFAALGPSRLYAGPSSAAACPTHIGRSPSHSCIENGPPLPLLSTYPPRAVTARDWPVLAATSAGRHRAACMLMNSSEGAAHGRVSLILSGHRSAHLARPRFHRRPRHRCPRRPRRRRLFCPRRRRPSRRRLRRRRRCTPRHGHSRALTQKLLLL